MFKEKVVLIDTDALRLTGMKLIDYCKLETSPNGSLTKLAYDVQINHANNN